MRVYVSIYRKFNNEYFIKSADSFRELGHGYCDDLSQILKDHSIKPINIRILDSYNYGIVNYEVEYEK